MRYDLTDFEWRVIVPLLPMDRRGPKLQNNRQGLYGIYRVLCAGASWRDLPERCGALHHRLQPLQSLAQGRHLGPFDGCHCVGARRQGADDRQLDRAGTSHASGVKKRVAFVVSVKAVVGSRRKSTLAATRKAGRSVV
jgi:transposase